jgi:ribose transport system substrate-binding protein
MQVFPDNPFWQTMKEAVEARAKEDGVTVDTIALPTASGVADQVGQMENAVTQQYDGIILGTVDAAGIVPGIEAANAAGIPVIAVDTAPAGGDFISLVQTDNIAAAQQGGQFIADKIGGKGKVLNLQGDLANQTGQARNEGVHKALDAYPDIQVIDQSTMWLGEKGLSITENILTSSPFSPPTTRRPWARCRRSRPRGAAMSSSSALTAPRTVCRRSRMASWRPTCCSSQTPWASSASTSSSAT